MSAVREAVEGSERAQHPERDCEAAGRALVPSCRPIGKITPRPPPPSQKGTAFLPGNSTGAGPRSL